VREPLSEQTLISFDGGRLGRVSCFYYIYIGGKSKHS